MSVPPETTGGRRAPNYAAPAAACAGEILQSLAAEGHPLTLTELERLTGRSKSLVFRSLRELEQLQFVVRVTDHRYRLGLHAFEVGVAFLSQDGVNESIRNTLRELADSTGESANLGVLRGSEVLYLAKFEGRGSYVTLSRVGGRVPASCTAGGKALLSVLDPEDLRRIVGEPLPQMTPDSLSTLDELERELETTRQRGYALDLGEAVPGRGGLAVVIPYLGHEAEYAAISLSTELHRFQDGGDERILRLVLDARERIVREMESRRALLE